MNAVEVETKHARYIVDRDNTRWMRVSKSPWSRPDDGQWHSGGFTLGEVGGTCFAHYNPPRADGAIGRWTSIVLSVTPVTGMDIKGYTE